MSVRKIRVWDLPTRLFHWTLVVLVTASIVTIKIGGNWVQWHFRCGYAILTLLLFRLVWGFCGTHYARFSHFTLSPREVFAMGRSLWQGRAVRALGHNPLGAVSILAMLASLAFQAVSGLFANDDVASNGPLEPFVSNATSDFISELHSWNAVVIYVLLGLHGVAILFYFFRKRVDLVSPMLSGQVAMDEDSFSETIRPIAIEEGWRTNARAAVILVACTLVVLWIVSRTPPPLGR